MVGSRPEEVTLPTRFICKTAHLVAILAVLFDVGVVVSSMLQIDPDSSSTSQADLDKYNSTKSQISGLCYGALACFGIEYITLFLGISMFFPVAMSLNILAHFVGTILVALWYTDNWNFDSFVAFFVIFNALPALLEVLMLVFVTKFSFLKY